MPRPRGTTRERAQERRLSMGGGKLIGYVRVSTIGQETNGHSLEGQRARLIQAAERRGSSWWRSWRTWRVGRSGATGSTGRGSE